MQLARIPLILSVTLVDNVTVYQMTRSGLALQATVSGTRYWKDGELNQS